MAGFARREIEYMQALCIYNIYIEYYSVSIPLIFLKEKGVMPFDPNGAVFFFSFKRFIPYL